MRIAAASIGLTVASSTLAQLVVGNDVDANMWLIDVEGISPPRAIARGVNALSGAIAADPMGTMYWVNQQQTLVKAAYNLAGVMTPVVVGNLTVGGSAAGNFVGLAYDTAARRLYAYRNNGALGSEGFYEINTTTAACTLVWASPTTALDFGGFDYDRAGDVFYAVNDSVTALPAGRGLYRLRKPLASPVIEFVVASPNNDSDIDGLAVGGGKAYLVNDNVTQGVYVFDLAGQHFETASAVPYTVNGTFAGATWAPEIVAADVGVELLVPPACGLAGGGEFEYSVLVRNAGPDAAKDVVVDVRLPATAGFVSSEPEGVVSAGVLRVALGHVQAGGWTAVRVRLVMPEEGTLGFVASASARTNDPATANNSATTERTIAGLGASARAGTRVAMSTVAWSPSSVIPDAALGGARFVSGSSVSLGRPHASRSGGHVVFAARTSAGTELSNDALFMIDSGGNIRLLAREGVTLLAGTTAIRGVGAAMPFQPGMGVQDDGHVAFAATDSGGLGFAARWNGAEFSILARQDGAVAAIGAGVTFARGTFACQVDRTDRAVLLARLAGTGITGSNDTLILRSGQDILMRTGQTAPGDQDGGTEAPMRAVPVAASDAEQVLAIDASGAHLLYRGALALADANKDEVLVVDNVVVVQEGVVLRGSGFGSPVRGSVATARFGGDGAWLAMGSNQDDSSVGVHWVVRNGQVIAKRGDAITACASERWVQGASDGLFLGVAGSARGDVVIAGFTDAVDGTRNEVLVWNSSRVLARAGDALDLDSNGLPDDGAFIEHFKMDHLELTDREAIVGVTISSPPTGDCGGAPVRAGEAILRIAIPCPADVDDGTFTGTADGGVTVEDLIYYLDIFAQGLPGADLDDGSMMGRVDCGVTVDDLLFFLVRFETGC